MSRQLVITADDLGVDPATNTTIVELLTLGLVSASTLITVAPAATDAVQRVRAAGVPEPRLHITLTSARELGPWRPLSGDVPSLTDHHGAFPVSATMAEWRAVPADVHREMAAQLAWMHRTGLRPTVLDSHSGSLYGMRGRSLARTAVDFCADHGLAMRLPRRLHPVLASAVPLLRGRHVAAVARADALGVRLPATMIGAWLPGRMLRGYRHMRDGILRQLRALPDGTSELVVHPAPERGARLLVGPEGRKRVWELRLLNDPVFARTLVEEDIRVVPTW